MIRDLYPRFRLGGSVALASCLVFVAACGSDAGEQSTETITLKYAHYIGPQSAQSVSIKKWADRISELTNGQVEVEFAYQNSLLQDTEILPGVADGRADMGYVGSFYFPAELPLTSVAEVPFVTSDAGAQARTFEDMYSENEFFRKEWQDNGVHVLTFNPIGATILAAPEPILSPEEIRGKSIRAAGMSSEVIKALNGNPVALPATDIYEAVQRGVIDGFTSFPFEIVTDLGVHEVAPHMTDPGIGQYVMPATVIKLETWEGLPEDVREAIEQASSEHVATAVQDLAEVEEQVCDEILAAGGSAIVWSEGNVAAVEEEVGADLLDQWLEDRAAEMGQEEAERYLEEYLATLEEHASGEESNSGVARCAERS